VKTLQRRLVRVAAAAVAVVGWGAQTPAQSAIVFATANGNLYTIDTTTAVPSLIGSLGVNPGGLAFVPTSVVPLPAALPLFLSALAGLGLMGWRRRQADA